MKDIATIATTKEILEKYQLGALKKFGQNFLIDINIIDKIITSVDINKKTAVIEVGPGIGALTQRLALQSGKVISFEIDERFKPVYRDYLNFDNLNIIFGDFMEQDIAKVVLDLREEFDQVYLIANLPYYITTPIIEKVVLENCHVDKIIVMIQKEVAKKMTSGYKNPLLLLLADNAEIEYLFTVSKNVFIPSPHVDSAVISITINQKPDLELYRILEICFKQRRKTIYNNLKAVYPEAKTILQQANVAINKRSEELELTDFKNITKVITEHII